MSRPHAPDPQQCRSLRPGDGARTGRWQRAPSPTGLPPPALLSCLLIRYPPCILLPPPPPLVVLALLCWSHLSPLDPFRENSQTSVRKIADVIREREDAGSNRDKIAEKQKEWLEAIRWALEVGREERKVHTDVDSELEQRSRSSSIIKWRKTKRDAKVFEARSIASAASTLGAEDLSTSALDVENSALEVSLSLPPPFLIPPSPRAGLYYISFLLLLSSVDTQAIAGAGLEGCAGSHPHAGREVFSPVRLHRQHVGPGAAERRRSQLGELELAGQRGQGTRGQRLDDRHTRRSRGQRQLTRVARAR
eukprot:765243-Hanusia_phi.AAC.2